MTAVVKYRTTSKDNLIEGASGALSATGAVLDVSGMTGALNTLALPADGNGGVTLGATMTISPETTAESGFLTITVAGVAYQIPIYAE